jgi:hypothetical protein
MRNQTPCIPRFAKETRRGQTLLEFVFVSILFVFMIYFTFNAVIAFSIHQYVRFSTFMAARAYQASRESQEQAADAARETLARYFSPQIVQSGSGSMSFPSFNRAVFEVERVVIPSASLGDYDGRRGEASAIQVTYSVPLLAGAPVSGAFESLQRIQLTARSSLGRDPSQQECLAYFRGLLNAWKPETLPAENQALFGDFVSGALSYVGTPGQGYFRYMDDNGC